MLKAQLIELNVDLVEKACLVIHSAVANAMDWGDIELLVKDAQAKGDPVAMAIHGLKLKTNEITLLLRYIPHPPCGCALNNMSHLCDVQGGILGVRNNVL